MRDTWRKAPVASRRLLCDIMTAAGAAAGQEEQGSATRPIQARYWLSAGFVSGHPPGERYGYLSDAALGDLLRSK